MRCETRTLESASVSSNHLDLVLGRLLAVEAAECRGDEPRAGVDGEDGAAA